MANATKIPFLDLVTPHKQLEDELIEVVRKAVGNAGFIGGPMVEEFEREFATFCDTRCCIAVSSGTDALWFSVLAAGIEPGDIVVTIPHTFIATTEAITQSGGQVAFVDIDEGTYTLDPDKLCEYIEKKCEFNRKSRILTERASNRRVRAVVPVHLYGQMADMDPIMDLAEKYNLMVIEDACQAHGAQYFSKKTKSWRKAGSMGKAAAFSFYPGKNLGALGEGGAITTNDEELCARLKMLRDHGQVKKYYHDIEGHNGRLDAIQAGILQAKLAYLVDWNEKRQRAAQRYQELLREHTEIVLPTVPDWAKPVFHLFVVKVKDRDPLMKRLAVQGIGTAIHYPIPLHLQKAYSYLGYGQGDFPVTEAAAPSILSLPMFPGLTETQRQTVSDALVEFVFSSQALSVQ